jgi:hypothetical protein
VRDLVDRVQQEVERERGSEPREGSRRVHALRRREEQVEGDGGERRADEHPRPPPSPARVRAVGDPTHQRVGDRVERARDGDGERDVAERHEHDVGVEDGHVDRDRNRHRRAREVGHAVGELDAQLEPLGGGCLRFAGTLDGGRGGSGQGS